MPAKCYIFYDKYCGDLRTMPCYFERLGISGVKIVNVHPCNPEKYNIPSIRATIILVDPKTGNTIAVMGGTSITTVRTGAAGGIAAKYLARRDSEVLALIGAGIQGSAQLAALSRTLPKLREVKVWSKNNNHKFIDTVQRQYSYSFKHCEKIEECLMGADVVSAQTPVRDPLVKSEWISSGMHINAIGADAPGKEEFDPAILKGAKVIVDDFEQAKHSGEINVPLNKGIISEKIIYGELGDIITGKKAGRTSNNEITLFDSTGLAVQDIIVATNVYAKAKASNIGRWITL
ncbi:MAG: ornithine cyclodeaminase family protein [Candidatus Bathyarchaeota archaeon]